MLLEIRFQKMHVKITSNYIQEIQRPAQTGLKYPKKAHPRTLLKRTLSLSGVDKIFFSLFHSISIPLKMWSNVFFAVPAVLIIALTSTSGSTPLNDVTTLQFVSDR